MDKIGSFSSLLKILDYGPSMSRISWTLIFFHGRPFSTLLFLDGSFYRISFLSTIFIKYVKLRPLFHKSPVWTSLVGSPIRSTYEMAISKRKDGELRFMRKMTMLEFVFRTPQQLLKKPWETTTYTPVLMKVIKGNFRLPSFKYTKERGMKGAVKGVNIRSSFWVQ